MALADKPPGGSERSEPSRVLRKMKEALHETGRKIGRLLGRTGNPDLAKKFPRQLVLSSTPWEVRVALIEDGLPIEYLQEWRQNQGNAGSVYKGRVTKVLPGMQAAFVDIGLEKAAFLYAGDYMIDNGDLDLGDDEASARPRRRGGSGPTSGSGRSGRPPVPPRSSPRLPCG